jgi:hypothetical protein
MMRLLRLLPLLIFGLLFAGGGLAIFSETALPTWQNWSAMQNWQPGYAQLLSVSGSENVTQARYRYEYDGTSYQSDRVYVAEFNDNIGSYHNDLLDHLRNQFSEAEFIPIWVNPLNPKQAVIDRDMRWGLFTLMTGFCLVFVSIGLLVIYAGFRPGKNQSGYRRPSLLALRKEWKQKIREPGFEQNFLEFSQSRIAESSQPALEKVEPVDWRTRKDWASSTIASQAGKKTLKIWGFAIFWNAISTPLLFTLPAEMDKQNYAALFVLMFPMVGIFLIYKALQSVLEYKRFGKVLMVMDPYPGAIGGHMGGKIQVSRLHHKLASDPSAEITVRLECVYSYISGSGKNRSRKENIKWAEEGSPRVQGSAQGTELSFRFDVPDNLPEADVEANEAYHFWRLSVSANISGVDLKRQYIIPVFKTGRNSRFLRHDISAQVLKTRKQESAAAKISIAQGNFDLPGLSRAMRLEDQGGQINLSFPMFRNKTLTLIAAIFAGGFGFASYSMIGMALESGGFGILLALFSIPFLLLAIVAAIAVVYLALNNLSVQIKPDRVSVTRRLLFVPVFSRLLNTRDITRLSIKRGGSTGQGVDKILHFKLMAHDNSGKTVTIAEDLDGEDVAAHFRDYIARRLNLEADDTPALI